MLTQARLKEVLHYDPSSGVFTWMMPKMLGKPVGNIFKKDDSPAYLRIKVDQKLYQAHRLVWLYVTGEFPNGPLDHKDGDGLNNRFGNLRECTTLKNSYNAKLSKNNTSGYKNVFWVKAANKWRVIFRVNKKSKAFGSFDNIQDAAERAKQVRTELHGEFARHV